MRCTDPRTVGFLADGKTITWSPKNYSKEYATFQLPCGKCIACRLEYARQWAIRCVHEASMNDKNSFITLTYSDENLKSPKLEYSDFQKFIKKLRKTQNQKIGIFVTGEYGDKTKRPHWHAILFNYSPPDLKPKYKTERGDQVYDSEILTKLWGHGITECGSVTFESAGYCARYAAKKLAHGNDKDHDFQPISKKSSQHAIGKKWLEKFWPDCFNFGTTVLPDGRPIGVIPRYYEKWLKENKPEEWEAYVTKTKQQKISNAMGRMEQEKLQENRINDDRRRIQGLSFSKQISREDARKKILDTKFKLLQSKLKL